VSLLYKDDWDEAKERYKAWWAGENTGRCEMRATAPREAVRCTRAAARALLEKAEHWSHF